MFIIGIYRTMLIILCLLFGVSLAPISSTLSKLDAAVKAAQYIWEMRTPDDDWGSFTPRAHIALSFVNKKFFQISEQTKAKMLKQVDNQLEVLLKIKQPSLSELAVAINAQYATCQDPRDFYGKDVVEVLRNKTDEEMKSGDFKLPIVMLALCLSRETRLQDGDQLVNIYDTKHDNIALKALTIIATAACKQMVNSALYDEFRYRAEDFLNRYKVEDNVSVFTKALIIQAQNAWGYYERKEKELLQYQNEDGSFGDLLSTYAVIPALLNQSLVDLKCKREYKEKSSRTPLELFRPERYVDMSLIIPEGEDVGKHTLRVTFLGRESLHQLMDTAQLRNPLFRFTVDELPTGKRVNTLAGIPNDVENGKYWSLFKRRADAVTDAVKETTEIDWIYPQDGDHYVWKLGE